MRTPRIYHPDLLTVDSTVTLTANAYNHVIRVLRLKVGAALILFNGHGGEYTAELAAIEKHRAVIKILQYFPIEKESSLLIHLGQAISRGEKMDFTLQKAVELGVTKITPLFTERGNVKLTDERSQKRMQHWNSVIIGACEQSGRNRIPEMIPPEFITDWISRRVEPLKLVLQPNADQHLDDLSVGKEICLLIGAEGGLSENEIEFAQKHNFTAIQLGPRVLRTETAALTMIAALQSRWGDLR